jgi:hypothetical protein
MTGLKGFNRDSFALAELALKEQGYEVRNPACLPVDWSEYQHYIEIGLVMLRQCERIVFLPGSEHSKGVAREKSEAEKHAIKGATPLLYEVWDALTVAYLANKEAV